MPTSSASTTLIAAPVELVMVALFRIRRTMSLSAASTLIWPSWVPGEQVARLGDGNDAVADGHAVGRGR